MLSISRIDSLSHGLSYYQKDNYYTKEEFKDHGHTSWFGKAASEFNLNGAVLSKDFNQALLGISKKNKLDIIDYEQKEVFVPSQKINNFKNLVYSYLEKTSLQKKDLLLIFEILNYLSEKRVRLFKRNLDHYFNDIISALNQSSIDHLEKFKIRRFIEKELKIFRLRAKRRLAYDLTFSAPKSVSLAALVGEDFELIKAHRLAILEVLKLVEKEYSQIRIRKKHIKQRQIEITGNIAVATFEHDVSRALDPQLHTHCVLMNFTKRDDETWRSIYQDGFFYESKKIGIRYQQILAKNILSLGYKIQTYSNGTFDIPGYSKDQLSAFSKRSAQLSILGAKNQKQKTKFIYKNRPKKIVMTTQSLRELWRLEASRLDIMHPKRFEGTNV